MSLAGAYAEATGIAAKVQESIIGITQQPVIAAILVALALGIS